MNTITVRKDELLSILETNRANHHAEFEQAFNGFATRKEAQLKEQLRAVREGRFHERWEGLPLPVEHLDDYDRVIRMIQLHIEDTITLQENDVAMYVMDQWNWKGQFTTSNAYYVQ